jgi:hypothetical protein
MMTWLALACIGQLTLPAEIRGEPGTFITITANTSGSIVRYVPLDSGLQVFPAHLLADKKSTVVLSLTPGRYRLLGYTAVDGNPTEPAVVSVVIGDKPTPPDQIPDHAALLSALSGIWGGHVERDKQAKLEQLITTYRAIDGITQDAAIKTTDALMRACVEARKKSGLADDAILPIRQRITEEWTRALGDADTPLTPELRAKARGVAIKVLRALEGLRS